jgi:hypothetical protein
MGLVKKPIHFRTAPGCAKVEPDLEHGQAPSQRLQRQSPNFAALESRPRRPMNARPHRAIQLPPAATPADCPHQPPELEVAHEGSIDGPALPAGYRALILFA